MTQKIKYIGAIALISALLVLGIAGCNKADASGGQLKSGAGAKDCSTCNS